MIIIKFGAAKLILKLKKKILKKYRQYKMTLKQHLIFVSANDKKIYDDLSHGKIYNKNEVQLYIKTAGKTPINCRNNNNDFHVIYATFFQLYHLPAKKLKRDAVILDLGSNIGLTMRHLKYLYPKSKIIGVELDRDNYLMAKKNLSGIKDCYLINAAIWYKDGFVNYEGSDSQSFHCVVNNDVAVQKKVKAYSLPALFGEYNLSKIDFVKMDIEGAESIIFKEDCSWLNCVQSLNLEVHNGEPLSRYVSILEKYGFKCELSKKHWSAILAYK